MKQSEIPTARHIRRRILEMSYAGQSVHIPSAYSLVEILRVLHEKHLRYPGNSPSSIDRDFLCLSKGHGVMALYPILEARGWIQREDLDNYFSDGSRLPGLCEAAVPGCEVNTGSLGHGIGVAVGYAFGSRMKGSEQRVFSVVGDGEMNEGSVWEALMFAGFHKLSNFTLVIDQNSFQAMGATSEILAAENLERALHSFGFEVVVINGHSELDLDNSILTHREEARPRPLAIIAKTVKGKGVSFMENVNSWHYTRLDLETYSAALKELGFSK